MSDSQEFRDRFPDEPERVREHDGDRDLDRDLDREHADDPRLPTTNQPLNAEPRPRWTPAVGAIALLAVILLVFLLLTWLR